jgi:hypothetical protein
MSGTTDKSFILKAIPTFGMADYESIMAFYIDFLAFKRDRENRFTTITPVYMQISKMDE